MFSALVHQSRAPAAFPVRQNTQYELLPYAVYERTERQDSLELQTQSQECAVSKPMNLTSQTHYSLERSVRGCNVAADNTISHMPNQSAIQVDDSEGNNASAAIDTCQRSFEPVGYTCIKTLVATRGARRSLDESSSPSYITLICD